MDEGLVKIRHARSLKDFPYLTLADDEYVERAFRRAPVRLALLFGISSISIVAVLLVFLGILLGTDSLDPMGRNFLYIILAVSLLTILALTFAALVVHRGNKLFVTNHRLIIYSMKSPFATIIRTIDLTTVKSHTFTQDTPLAKSLGYGTLTLTIAAGDATKTLSCKYLPSPFSLSI